ncbi:hypothetical protein B9Z55_021423 [Caenorhabditis nigoni]|nr:hypothetical protein B9Z55_021423 [Caenorhabditis nigoni]
MLLYENIIIHVLLFASAILYIPISVSIRRKAHLASIIKNQPEKFILYQTFGLAAFTIVSTVEVKTVKTIFKWFFFQTSLRLHIFYLYETDREPDELILYGNHFDFFTTPVMIQMSYLLSNKRHLDTIKNIFKRRNQTVPSIPISAAHASAVDA